jgi:endoglucanase
MKSRSKIVLCGLMLLSLVVSFGTAFARAEASFKDTKGHFAEEDINELADDDIVSGYSDDTYRPNDFVSRGEAAKILTKGFSLSSNGKGHFKDVKDDEWYASYVVAVEEAGLFEGYSDGTFKPDGDLSRAEAAKVLALAAGLDLSNGGGCFSDVSSDDWFAPYVCALSEDDIVSGYGNGTFGPANSVTRGELAKMMVRILHLLKGDGGDGESVDDYDEDMEKDEEDDVEDLYEQVEENPYVSSYENPFEGEELYVNLDSDVYDQIEEWEVSWPDDAEALLEIAREPVAKWFGDWNDDIEEDVGDYVSELTDGGYLPVMVVYNIPDRDCGNYSAGGSSDATAYSEWIQGFADGIGNRKAVVILEPDALSLDCTSGGSDELLAAAVSTLKENNNTFVYIDAGHADWVDADEMAERLLGAGIEEADGFSLNVSNYYSTEENIEYGEEISALVGEAHFIIDTGRNGNGSNDGEWCNPSGMAIGEVPTFDTGNSLVDAYLWVKQPGDSDGTCNGGPDAGDFWAEMALELVGR